MKPSAKMVRLTRFVLSQIFELAGGDGNAKKNIMYVACMYDGFHGN